MCTTPTRSPVASAAEAEAHLHPHLDRGAGAGVLSRPIPMLPTLAAASSVLIVNALVVDGTGAPARPAAVRVRGDRIAEVGALSPAAGENVLDAKGLVLAPGFIDTHSHGDR